MLIRTIIAALLLISSVSSAEPVSKAQLKELRRQYLARQPQTGLGVLDYNEALRVQGRLVELLVRDLGKVAGYKVGLVTPAGQRRFGIDHPVRGTLLKRMLLPNDSKVSARYGTQPILEADLIVQVKDRRINEANTPEEAARHLSSVIAFIELADTTLATNPPITAGALVASNVGARAGILGEEQRIEPGDDFVKAFGKMQIVLIKNSQEVSRVSAEGILGHPLNAALWLIKDMNAHGQKLKAGDLLSLGSPSPQVSPRAGEKYTLVYEGLPGGDLHASVSIE